MAMLNHFTFVLFPYAAGWFIIMMLVRSVIVLRRGYKFELGTAKGSPRRGIFYSLTFSMLPWKKDSTRRHPYTYLAGMGMHLGLFLTFCYAIGGKFLQWSEMLSVFFGVWAAIGFVSAFGLYVKRNRMEYMKPISNLDDFLANLFVQFYLLAGFLAVFFPEYSGIWRLSAIVLLVYAPLGKIYHMVLFFISRTLFGLQFGRRGVLKHDFPISY